MRPLRVARPDRAGSTVKTCGGDVFIVSKRCTTHRSFVQTRSELARAQADVGEVDSRKHRLVHCAHEDVALGLRQRAYKVELGAREVGEVRTNAVPKLREVKTSSPSLRHRQACP